jgi:hypothetical protein
MPKTRGCTEIPLGKPLSLDSCGGAECRKADYNGQHCKLTVKLHMRVKKAFRQLNKAEALISAVADRYTPNDTGFRELLDSARASIEQAKSALNSRSHQMPPTSERAKKKGSQAGVIPEFKGNKTDFVRAVVEGRGSSGATPTDINEAFAIRGINKSNNLVYNSLSALTKNGKLKKQGQRYFVVSSGSNVKSVPAKKRISPEGLKRIIEANKRRWAKRKAVQATAATRKSPTRNRRTIIARKASAARGAANTPA